MKTPALIFLSALIFGVVPVCRAADSAGAGVRVSVQGEGTQLALSFLDNNSPKTLDFVPNNPVMIKVGVQYKDLGASYGSGVGSQDRRYHVSSTCRDLQLFYYSGRFGGDLYYQSYKGYYVDASPGLPEGLYPGLRTRTYTGNLYFKIGGSADLSAFNATLTPDKSSKYLLFAVASLSDRSVFSDKPLVPPAYRRTFPDFIPLKRFHAVNPSLSAGFLAPVSWGRVYLNSSLSAGLGFPLLRTNISLKQSYSVKVNLKIKTGYEGKRFSYGLVATGDGDAIAMANDQTVLFTSMGANVFMAVKF